DYEPRLVAELCKHASAARAAKDFVGAAAAFNRALAFRPDDSELLRQVAQIARGESVRRVVKRGSLALLGIAAVLAVVAGFVAWLRSRPATGATLPSAAEQRPAADAQGPAPSVQVTPPA